MSNANEIIQPPKQVSVPQEDIVAQEILKDAALPSDDIAISKVETATTARKPVEPTYRGWKEVAHWDHSDALTADDELSDLTAHSSFLDTYLPAKLYGDWYHGVGIFFVAGSFSFFLGWLRFSLAPVFFVMVFCSLIYRTSIKKYRQVLRDQAQREFSVKAIENDHETMDWLNSFLDKFWIFLEPSVAQIVCANVNPILASSPAPAFIKALWIDTFTAGTKPPRIDLVKTLPRTNDDVVVMDWGISFTPNALADANFRQMKNKIDQKTVVKLKLFGLTIPVSVSQVSFRLVVRVRIRMMSAFPHFETANISLLEPPQYDFVAKLCGDTVFNWELLSIPGLHLFIDEMIKKYVGPLFYAPLSFQLNIQQLLSGNALDSAIGILAITVHSARNLKGFDTIGNTLDPYVTFGFHGKILGRTRTIHDTKAPVWNETTYICVRSISDPLTLSVVDFNDIRKDKVVGKVQQNIETLLDEPKQENIAATVLRNNKPVGELLFDLHYMPTLEAQTQADGAIIPPPELNTGIARIKIAEARHLKQTGSKALSTFVELYINNELKFSTKIQKKTNTPSWNQAHEDIITDRRKTRVKLVLKDKNDNTLGQISSTLNELIDSMEVDKEWFPLPKGGELRISSTWKPVALTSVSGSGGYTEPIGVLRVNIEKAQNLRNLETVGTIDPYARVLINGFQRGRTVAQDSTLNPVWNEVIYVTITSANQRLTIEGMDVEKHSPDRTLGSFDLKLNEIVKKDETGKYAEYIDTKKRENKLVSKKGPKGTITYSLSFYPCLPVMDLEEIEEEESEEKRLAEEKAKKAEEEATNPPEKSDKESKAPPKDSKVPTTDISKKRDKLKLTLDELTEYKSGVFVYKVIGGDFSKSGTYVQAFFDNHGFYDYLSPKIDGKDVKIGTTGDVVIRELDWSKCSFRLVKDQDNNRAETPIAEVTIPTLQLLKNSYLKPQVLTLSGASTSEIKIQCSWIPFIFQTTLPAEDSITNVGTLNISLLNASNLIAADRNGKSDPYITLFLNNIEESFFKSKKIKKTLNPTYNEDTSVAIGNRVESVIKVVAMDWDIGPEKDDLLGVGYVKLSDVDPIETTDISVPLTGENGEDGGVVNFRFSFKPEFVLMVSANSTNAVGTTIGTGLGAIGTVGKGVGGAGIKVVGKGGSFIKKGLHLGKKSSE